MTALDDRREQAIQEFYEWPIGSESDGAKAAIEVATQVRITDEVINAGRAEMPHLSAAAIEIILESTLKALGFEVVE